MKTLASTEAAKYLTIPQAAARLGLSANRLRRLFERGKVPPVEIIAGRRMVPEAELGRLREAARKAGYLE